MNTQNCVADAAAQAKFVGGCTKNDAFWSRVRPPAGDESATLLNIGANKGYEIAAFVERWAPERKLSHGLWYNEIMRHGKDIGSKHLKWSAAGGCHDKDHRMAPDELPRPPLNGAKAKVNIHAFELNGRTARLIEALARVTGVSDIVRVHQQPVSDHDGAVCTQQGPAGYERGGIQHVGSARARKCASWQNATTVDAFVAAAHLGGLFHVEVDTEGHDAAVLAGMRRTLTARQVRLLEFEYSGQWPTESAACVADPAGCKTNRRTLGRTLRWMWEQAGYRCFFYAARHAAAAKAGGRHAAADLVPISPPCWQPSLEVRAWSNVLCAWRDDDLAVLHNLSASAYAERQQARQAAPS